MIECRCLWTITVIYCLFDAGLSIVGGHNEVYHRLRKLHNENDEFCALNFRSSDVCLQALEAFRNSDLKA